MAGEKERLHNLFPNLDFDPEALRAKYREERDKRLRTDGESQYIEAAEAALERGPGALLRARILAAQAQPCDVPVAQAL